jgi:hypothetical protein
MLARRAVAGAAVREDGRVSVTTASVGAVRCTRVGYVDVEVEPDAVGLTAEQVAGTAWGEPVWALGHHVRVGAAAWIIESGDARIVVDPLGAADAILRDGGDAIAHQEAFAANLAAAGLARESITHAIATHLDGIGMLAWRHDDDTWGPFFPNATIQMSRRELDALDAGLDASGFDVLAALRALGAVVASDDDQRITHEVSLELTGSHSPGHQMVRIDSQGERAVMVGHLAISPLHLAAGECRLNLDPAAAHAALRAVRDEGSLLIGPLWPAPGAGRWHDGTFVPISTLRR